MKKMLLFWLGFWAAGLIIISGEVKDIEPKEAFKMLDNPSVYLIDVRSIAEYVWIGHPETAFNIPKSFWEEKTASMIPNDNFILDVKARFKPDDVLILMCRSGGRSARAARMLEKEGFQNLFNLKYGFEGDSDPQGFRTLNGWKNSGLPYTYDDDTKYSYRGNES